MEPILYSVAASSHERLVQAPDAAEALKLVLADDDFFRDQKTIVVTRRDDVLRAGGRKAAKSADGDVPKGLVLASALAEELELTMEGLKYRMKKHGITGQRLGTKGRPLAVTLKEADKLAAE